MDHLGQAKGVFNNSPLYQFAGINMEDETQEYNHSC
jgi:hypothetical protein